MITPLLAFLVPLAFVPAKPQGYQKALSDAADLMEKGGHSKHSLWRKWGEREALCIQGAIFKAVTGNANWPNSYTPAEQALVISQALRAAEKCAGVKKCGARTSKNLCSGSLAKWNNADEREASEGIDVLRKAARV